MASLHLTYMLLPSFSFAPDQDIQLGTLLALSDTTKLPDPTLPLVAESRRTLPAEDSIKREVEEPADKPWCYSKSLRSGISGSFSFEVPFLSAFSAGLTLQRTKAHDLRIECRRVETSCFSPTEEYMAAALEHAIVKQYASSHWRPSIFMVTGIKVAYDVKIDIGSVDSSEGSGNLSVDLTGFNAPIKLGPEGQHLRNQQNSIRTEKPGPLILAYQLKRIRLKRAGSFAVKAYDKHAILFNDDDAVVVASRGDELNSKWDIEDVSSESSFDDFT